MYRLLEAVIVIILTAPIRILPVKISLKIGELIGLALFYIWSSRRKIAEDNLIKTMISDEAFSERDTSKILKENFKNFGRSLAEIIKVYSGSGKKIIESIKIEGIENYYAASQKGRGVVFLTGHCGNWELLALVCSLKVSPIAVVARPLDNSYLNKIVEGIRRKFGNIIIYKRGALKPIIQTLKKNGVVGILMDQAVVRNEGFVIDFLGRGAWTTKMPALIVRKTGAAAIPVFIHRNGDSHLIKIYPEVELSKTEEKETALIEDTKKLIEYIENYIREHPAEWLWIHRRWKRVNPDKTII